MIRHKICDTIKCYNVLLVKATQSNKLPYFLQEAIAAFNCGAILSANDIEIFPVFIFDGETAGTKSCGYNRMKFLLECLGDLDEQLRDVGSQLFICR